MVNIMDKEEFKKLVKKHSPSEPRGRNVLVAFLSGGAVGVVGELLVMIFRNCFAFSCFEAMMWVSLVVILLATLFTALGFFDNLVTFCKCGLIIPTTGFAHSVASSALDYRKDGLITGLGANFFKLAGSVILYGIITSFFLVIIKVVIGG